MNIGPSVSGDSRPWIVVVDDDDGCLVELRRVMGSGYRVSSYLGGKAALEAIKASGAPDLIITDQRMPDMLGTELLEQLVDLHPASVGIIISGFTARNDLVSAINQARVFAYVAKPWRGQYLKETIERALTLARGRKASLSLSEDIGTLQVGLGAVAANAAGGGDREISSTLAAVRRQLSELAERSKSIANKAAVSGRPKKQY